MYCSSSSVSNQGINLSWHHPVENISLEKTLYMSLIWELLRKETSLGPNLHTLRKYASLNLQGFETLQVWAQTCRVS